MIAPLELQSRMVSPLFESLNEARTTPSVDLPPVLITRYPLAAIETPVGNFHFLRFLALSVR